MSEQPVNGGTNVPADVDLIPVVPREPLTSVQSQIGLALTAIATVIAFIFHKDFSPLVPAMTVLGFTIYGAAVSIARAMKHRTVVQAHLELHAMDRDIPPRAQVQAAFNSVSADVTGLHERMAKLEEAQKPVPKPARKTAKKAAQRPARGRTTARKTTRTRKLEPTY